MPNLGKRDWLIIGLAVLYIFIPFDLIPEMVAGPIGLTDDLGAVAVIMATLMRARGREQEADPPTEGNPSTAGNRVVKGQVIPPQD